MINQSELNILSNAINSTVLTDRQSIEQERKLVNLGGVLNGPVFILIAFLIVVSVSSVWMQTHQIHLHQRYLRMYFNANILGLDYQGIYEDGNNIDQSSNQIVTFDDMCTLLKDLSNVTNDYHDDGLVWFETTKQETELISLQFQFYNNSFGTLTFATVEEIFDHFQGFQTNFTREFLLSIKQMKIKSKLGSSKFVNNYVIQAKFTLHQRLIIQAQFEYNYDQPKSEINKKLRSLRILEQLSATVLFASFIYRLLSLKNTNYYPSDQKQKILKEKYKKWYIFMSLSNLVIIFSDIYAPMAAWIQILPLFQFPNQEQKEEYQSYNINKNLRFSPGLILTIWLPLLLSLNGFIFYSMLMYANDDDGYFSSYFRAFCDYFYNMFQCGTYQLFYEMQKYGPFAQILYAFLYFYVFMVGNSLIPAFFCTLMQLKINQREITDYSANLMEKAICPNCTSNSNYKFDGDSLSILVSSPRLTPLIKQKKLALSPSKLGKSQTESKQIMLQIQHDHEEVISLKNRYKLDDKFVSYTKKVQSLFRQLNKNISKQRDITQLMKMKSVIQRYQNKQNL